jgi:DNA-directed RNA polymerase specialized sigma24 family protein
MMRPMANDIGIVRLTPRRWACVPAPDPGPMEPWRWLDPEDLDEAIAQLELPFATAIRMVLQGTSPAEAARKMNVPIGTVVARILRGRRRLRRILDARLPARVRERASASRR